MNSIELINSCKKAFDEYHLERESFETLLAKHLNRRYGVVVDMQELEYFLSSCKSFHWRSFYNGFLIGKNEQTSTDTKCT